MTRASRGFREPGSVGLSGFCSGAVPLVVAGWPLGCEELASADDGGAGASLAGVAAGASAGGSDI